MLDIDPSITEYQKQLVSHLVKELNRYDNVYYEICNEPGFSRSAERIAAWQKRLNDVLRKEEAKLPNKHLSAVNTNINLLKREDDGKKIFCMDDTLYHKDNRIDILNYHYLSARNPQDDLNHWYEYSGNYQFGYRFGSIAEHLERRSKWKKSMIFDEDFAGFFHHRTPRPNQNRMEAWETLLSGGAGYDHLDMTFSSDDPRGEGNSNLSEGLPREWFDGRKLRNQLQYLATLLQSLDLAAMHPRKEWIQASPENTKAVTFAHKNHSRYLIYLGDCRPIEGGFGEEIPAGKMKHKKLRFNYRATWIDPKTGCHLSSMITGKSTNIMETPPFYEDLLLDIEIE